MSDEQGAEALVQWTPYGLLFRVQRNNINPKKIHTIMKKILFALVQCVRCKGGSTGNNLLPVQNVCCSSLNMNQKRGQLLGMSEQFKPKVLSPKHPSHLYPCSFFLTKMQQTQQKKEQVKKQLFGISELLPMIIKFPKPTFTILM